VVEKSLKYCSESAAATVVTCLAQEPLLQELAFHQFGNYVVQTALVVAPVPQLTLLVRHLQPMLPQLRLINFGRKIEAKVEAALRRLHTAPVSPSRGGGTPIASQRQQSSTPPPMPPVPLT
jgi:hypothetical protein